jgi:hypothetical protein
MSWAALVGPLRPFVGTGCTTVRTGTRMILARCKCQQLETTPAGRRIDNRRGIGSSEEPAKPRRPRSIDDNTRVAVRNARRGLQPARERRTSWTWWLRRVDAANGLACTRTVDLDIPDDLPHLHEMVVLTKPRACEVREALNKAIEGFVTARTSKPNVPWGRLSVSCRMRWLAGT